ncbi:MAG: tyrosine-type recombinase/integrase [Deltaproteobacteria bacterium]|nr:tyrosine-type recombinase/integrase [Deltaproteobacteria bacterium]
MRFLRWHGIVNENLALAVPSVKVPRLARVPHYLKWEDVQRMVAAVDATESEGIRDRALLLLLAELGLRNGEIRELVPRDIDWRNGHIRIRRTKTRKERIVPLTKEVGKALADYLLHGRPTVPAKQIFVRHRAPYGPFVCAGAISEVVEKYAERVGIKSPRLGSHLLRHSLATRLVNKGVPIKHIADVLGHESINTTAIYTKVDRASLDDIALPFPGGAK